MASRAWPAGRPVATAAALVHAAYGAAVAAPTSAVAGFRNATPILFAVIVGLDIGDLWGCRTVATCFLASAAFGVLLSLIEIADPVWCLALIHAAIHAADFGNLKNSLSIKPHLAYANPATLGTGNRGGSMRSLAHTAALRLKLGTAGLREFGINFAKLLKKFSILALHPRYIAVRGCNIEMISANFMAFSKPFDLDPFKGAAHVLWPTTDRMRIDMFSTFEHYGTVN